MARGNGPGRSGREWNNGDPALRRIFEEIRDLKVELRDDRRQSALQMERFVTESRLRDERWERERRDFQQRLERAEAKTQRMFQELRRDIRLVGLAVVKTLNRHTRLLESHTTLLQGIDRKLGTRGNGAPGNGRAA